MTEPTAHIDTFVRDHLPPHRSLAADDVVGCAGVELPGSPQLRLSVARRLDRDRSRRTHRAPSRRRRVDLPPAVRNRQSHRARPGRGARPRSRRPRAVARAQSAVAGRLLVRRDQSGRGRGNHDAAAPAARTGGDHRAGRGASCPHRRSRCRGSRSGAESRGRPRDRCFNTARRGFAGRQDRRASRRSSRTSTPLPTTRDHRVHLRHDRPRQGHRALSTATFSPSPIPTAPRPQASSRTTSSSARRHSRSRTASADWCSFPMRFGASTALLEHASPPLLLEGIQKYRATITVTSPTGYRAMIEQAGQFDLTSSAQVHLGRRDAARRRRSTRGHEATGIRLMDGIGSTECSTCSSAAPGRGAARIHRTRGARLSEPWS